MNTYKLVFLDFVNFFVVLHLFISCSDSSDDGISTPPDTDPPTIVGFESDSLVAGETLVIEGVNFSTTPTENLIAFNGSETVATSATNTTLEVVVPEGSETGEIIVTVNGKGDTSPEPLHILIDIPRTGLLFFLPFDFNADDIIGGKSGDVQGATLISDRFNNVNSAYDFNGDDYILYSNEGLHPLRGLTISLWVYVPVFHNAWLVSNFSNSILGPGGYELQLGGIDEQWITGSIGNYLGAAGNPAPLTLAQWVNVTMTFDESYMDLWINGKLELHSGNSRDLVIPHHKELVLGASLRLLDGGSFFNGRLDDLAIYDRVLSEPEIQQLFIQTVTSKPVQTYFNSFPTNHPEIPIEGPTIEDSEGNIYRIATIGGQIWMVDNLKSTICSDGTELPNVTDDGAWEFSTLEPAYCWYNNDQINMHDVYGALYNFYAVSGECNVCPDGWHIPSIAEWTVLIESLGGLEEAGGKMKTADQRYWAAYDHTATNESGFSAIAAGFRRIGLSQHIGYTASFWSSTPGTKHALDDSGQSVSILSQNGELVINPTQFLTAGLSVRCIQD